MEDLIKLFFVWDILGSRRFFRVFFNKNYNFFNTKLMLISLCRDITYLQLKKALQMPDPIFSSELEIL